MLIWILETIYMLGVCAFACWKGNLEERWAGGWTFLNISVYTVSLLFENASPTLSLINDGIFSVGLLPLAMIFVSWGVGVMTIVQAFSFAVQAFYLLSDQQVDQRYLALLNSAALIVTTTLLVSTLLSMRRRRRATREAIDARSTLSAIPAS